MHRQSIWRCFLVSLILTPVGVARSSGAKEPGAPAEVIQRVPGLLVEQTNRALEWAFQQPAAVYVPEGAVKFWNILSGAPMGKMFTLGSSRYDWNWLAARFDKNNDGRISTSEFGGPLDLFERLDRNRDKVLTAIDLDWSEESVLVKQNQRAFQTFRDIDKDSNGQISAEEWSAFFAHGNKGRGYLNQEDVQELFYPFAPLRPLGSPRYMEPSGRIKRLQALLQNGTAGLWHDAPRVNSMAPDFELKTQDETERVRLSQFRGKRPVVLVFGSFT